MPPNQASSGFGSLERYVADRAQDSEGGSRDDWLQVCPPGLLVSSLHESVTPMHPTLQHISVPAAWSSGESGAQRRKQKMKIYMQARNIYTRVSASAYFH